MNNNSTPDIFNRRPPFIIPKCTTSFRKDTVGGIHTNILTTIYAINMVTIIVANILLVIGICKTRKKNKFTNSNKLFLFLCASDLSAGLVLMPLQIYYVHLVPDITCVRTGIRAFWSSFPILLSGINILVITLDRFLMMTMNNFYRRWFSGKWVILYVIIVEVAISFGWALWYVFSTQTIKRKVSGAFFIGLSAYTLAILLPVIILNVKMVSSVKLSRKDTTLTNNNRAEQVLSKTITMISVALVVCYIPSAIATGMAGFYILYSKDRDQLRNVTIALIYCLLPTQLNSALNAIIYLLRNSRIRNYYKRQFHGTEHTDGYDTNDSLASHKGMYRLSAKKNYHTYIMEQRSNSSSVVSLAKNGDTPHHKETPEITSI